MEPCKVIAPLLILCSITMLFGSMVAGEESAAEDDVEIEIVDLGFEEIYEGMSIIHRISAYDPGVADAYDVIFDDGTGKSYVLSYEPAEAAEIEKEVCYMEEGVYTASVLATDEDGSAVLTTKEIRVINYPAQIAGVHLSNPTPGEGQEVYFLATIIDSSPLEADGWDISWIIDGEDYGTGPVISGLFDDGNHDLVCLVAEEGHGVMDIYEMSFDVKNFRPSLVFISDGLFGLEGDVVTLELEIEDAWDRSLTVTVDWGDGSSEVFEDQYGLVSYTHVYPDETPEGTRVAVSVCDATDTVEGSVESDIDNAPVNVTYTLEVIPLDIPEPVERGERVSRAEYKEYYAQLPEQDPPTKESTESAPTDQDLTPPEDAEPPIAPYVLEGSGTLPTTGGSGTLPASNPAKSGDMSAGISGGLNVDAGGSSNLWKWIAIIIVILLIGIIAKAVFF